MQSLQITAVAGGNGNLSEDSPRPKYMPCLKGSTVRQLSEKKNTMKLGAFKPETPEVLKKNSKNEKQMRPFCFSTKASFWGRWASSNIWEMAKVLLPDQLKNHTPSARRIFDEDDLQFEHVVVFPMDWMNLCQRWCCSSSSCCMTSGRILDKAVHEDPEVISYVLWFHWQSSGLTGG